MHSHFGGRIRLCNLIALCTLTQYYVINLFIRCQCLHLTLRLVKLYFSRKSNGRRQLDVTHVTSASEIETPDRDGSRMNNLIKANHAKAWDAKLLAYVSPKRNRVAGLPGGLSSLSLMSPRMPSRTPHHVSGRRKYPTDVKIFSSLYFSGNASDGLIERGKNARWRNSR